MAKHYYGIHAVDYKLLMQITLLLLDCKPLYILESTASS